MIIDDNFAVHMVTKYYHGTSDIKQALFETNEYLQLGLTKHDINNHFESIINNNYYNSIGVKEILAMPLTERKILCLRKFVNYVKNRIQGNMSYQFESECQTARNAIDLGISQLRSFGVIPKWWQFWKTSL